MAIERRRGDRRRSDGERHRAGGGTGGPPGHAHRRRPGARAEGPPEARRVAPEARREGQARRPSSARADPRPHPARELASTTLRRCDLAIEAIVENEEPKLDALPEARRGSCRRRASSPPTRSSISITKIAAATRRPEQVHRHALHEPASGDEARRDHPRPADERRDLPGVLDRAAQRFGKTTVTSQGRPGLHREPHPHPAAQRGLLRAQEGLATAPRTSTPA